MNAEEERAKAGEGPPGLPWFRSWQGVYGFVLLSFAVFVGLLTWFTHAFSR